PRDDRLDGSAGDPEHGQHAADGIAADSGGSSAQRRDLPGSVALPALRAHSRRPERPRSPPAGTPLSIEWSRHGSESDYSAAEWAKIALDGTREFMQDYYAES